MPLKGSCLCGDIRFRIEAPVDGVSACHCEQCRKVSGNYLATLNTEQDGLILEQGDASIAWYPDRAGERGFCVICGCALFWRYSDERSSRVWVSAGAIDGDTGLTIKDHVHTSEKGDYYEIPKEEKQYKEGRE